MKKMMGIFVLLALLLSSPALADTRAAIQKRTALVTALREMFATGAFAKLDRGMNQIQLEYEKGQWKDFELFRLFDRPFSAKDPAFETLYNKWVATYPQSYAAHVERGEYYYSQAVREFWAAKNAGTPMTAEQAAKIRQAVEQSVRDYSAALALSTKPAQAYAGLIANYTLMGARDKSRKLLDESIKAMPQYLMTREQYVNMLDFGADSAGLAELQAIVDGMRKAGFGAEESASILGSFHEQLLRAGRYEQLDKEMNDLQLAYAGGKIDDALLEVYFSIFNNADPTLAQKYDAWVKAYPRSYAARQARSHYYLALAWQARGGKIIKDTTQAEIAGMELYLKRGLEDSRAAAAPSIKPILAYRNIIRFTQLQGGRDVMEQALALANTLDPKNSIVRYSYFITLESRWGGSLAQMEKFLVEAKAAGINEEQLMLFEDDIVEEKIWIADRTSEEFDKIGQLITGF